VSTRNPDGRFRNNNKPLALSADMLRSRWVEAEVLHLKRVAFSYEATAQQITEIGRGRKKPHTPFLAGVKFPPDYKITAMGCHKALRRALRRVPALEAAEMRRLDTDRCEEMYRSLTPSIQDGDPQAVKAAVQVLALKAGINGYKSSEMEVNVSAEPSWSSVLSKDETIRLFKEAISLLMSGGIQIEEITRITGGATPGPNDNGEGAQSQRSALEAPTIELEPISIEELRAALDSEDQ